MPELEVEKVTLELERLRLQPGDLLVVKLHPNELFSREQLKGIRDSVISALRQSGLENQVLIMPKDFELAVVSS